MITTRPICGCMALVLAFGTTFLAGLVPVPAHSADRALELATLMTGSEGELRDAMEADFVPTKKRVAGCRSFSSDSGSGKRFMNSRLLTARPHAAVHMGPGKHFCVSGFVVGRNLRLQIVGETTGWFRIKLGDVEGWVPAKSVRREL
ncbi:MAG: hypothetical protein J4F47_09210 [Alphaproteobacteria bacterium]|nr:hypothetical protein [Alphaproteobacteria bacterium]